jgi:hypothetical protein
MESLRESINEFLITANGTFYEWRLWLADFWSRGFNKWFIVLLVASAVLLAFLYRRGRKNRQEASMFEAVSQGLAGAFSPASLASLVFEALFKALPVPAACFYLRASSNAPFLLGAKQLNSHSTSANELDWEPEALLEEIPEEPRATKQGRWSVFSLPIDIGGHPLAMVQVPLIPLGGDREIRNRCGFIRSLLRPVLAQLVILQRNQKLEENTREASVVSGSSQMLLSTTLGLDQLANLLLELSIRSTASEAGVTLLKPVDMGQEGIQVLASSGIERGLSRFSITSPDAGRCRWDILWVRDSPEK